MALEDLTGTGKFVSALNPAWPVDDDWVDEGDNHIRGIKNVLKNTFPVTNGAISWSSTQALFPDGLVNAPGIGWTSEPATGFYKTGGSSFSISLAGAQAAKWGSSVLSHPQLTIFSGGHPTLSLANIQAAPLYIKGLNGAPPTIGLDNTAGSGVSWQILAEATSPLKFGASSVAGPAAIGGYALSVGHDGICYARSFNPTTLLMTDAVALTGGLSALLDLRGVRYTDAETGRPGIGLELAGLEERFPELVKTLESGKGIDYMALLGPIVEALRELDARLKRFEDL